MPDKPGWRSALPTALPPRRRDERNKAIASILFNTFLLVSAVTFAVVVLVREQNYVLHQSPPGSFEHAAANGPVTGSRIMQTE
jgi:hypothetical protein